MNQAVVRPFFNEGVQDGYIVSNIAPNSLYEKMGLQNGDVIVDINNRHMQSADNLLQMVGLLQSGGSINLNGWQVQLNGAPAVGDTFTVQRNSGAAGDNRNALALSNIQNQSVLTNGTVSIGDAVSSIVTSVGTRSQQINSSQAAQAAINTQAQQNKQSISGVNLDEEAAALLQWQQAYQAAAQALKIGTSLFDTVLAAFH